MKKLFSLLAAILISSGAIAGPKTVPVVWPFSVASQQANMVRALIDRANEDQKKYQFLFMSRPGAGGAVAAKSVAEASDLEVLVGTSSFYVRPLLFKESHNVDDFNMVGTLCMAQPLGIFSKKVKNPADVKTLGVIPGSITMLVARTIARNNPQISILEVPYKGTPEATSDVLGGYIDGSVDFAGNSVTSRFGPSVNVLGVTGKRSIKGYKTFQSQNIKGLEEVVHDNLIFVNKKVDVATREEFNQIFKKAMNDPKVVFACEDDFGQVAYTPFDKVNKVNEDEKNKWKAFTNGIPKE